jgi:RHS repeat-associated protein
LGAPVFDRDLHAQVLSFSIVIYTGGTYQLGYDPNSGNPTTTKVGGTLLATASYNSTTGRPSMVTYSNGTKATFGYDAYGNPNQVTYTKTSGTIIDADSVIRSLAGRESSETMSGASGSTLIVNYSYDGAGRLIGVQNTNGSTDDGTYSYANNVPGDQCADPNEGENTNRTSVTVPSGTTDNCYNGADQLVSSITGGVTDTNYAYNALGDQTEDNGTTYTWDASNRVLTSTTSGGVTTDNTYDAVDRLVQSSPSTGSTARYSYAGYSDAPAAILNSSNAVIDQIVSLPGGVQVTIASAGNTWSYSNLHGDITFTTAASGTVTDGPLTYDPWGNLNPGQSEPPNTTGVNSLGAYGTDGKLTNTSTGTVLLGARLFNPSEGRFLSVDPITHGCANGYVYTFGDPLNSQDLSGQSTTQPCSSFSVQTCTTDGSGDCGTLNGSILVTAKGLSVNLDVSSITLNASQAQAPGIFLGIGPVTIGIKSAGFLYGGFQGTVGPTFSQTFPNAGSPGPPSSSQLVTVSVGIIWWILQDGSFGTADDGDDAPSQATFEGSLTLNAECDL